MFMFRDGSIAYLEKEKNQTLVLKNHLTKINMLEVQLKDEGKCLIIEVAGKLMPLKFYFETAAQGDRWAKNLKLSAAVLKE